MPDSTESPATVKTMWRPGLIRLARHQRSTPARLSSSGIHAPHPTLVRVVSQSGGGAGAPTRTTTVGGIGFGSACGSVSSQSKAPGWVSIGLLVIV